MGDPRGLIETAFYGLTVGMFLPLLQRLSESWHTGSVVGLVLLLSAAPLWLMNIRYDLPSYANTFMVWHLLVAVACLAVAFLDLFGVSW